MKQSPILVITCSAILGSLYGFTMPSIDAHAKPAQASTGETSTSKELFQNSENAQSMVYDIFAGGINAVSVELDIVYENKQDYKLDLRAHTKGWLGNLVPWSGSFTTVGWRLLDMKKEQPKQHKSISVWREEKEVKKFNYAKDGRFLNLKIEEEGVDKSPNPEKLTDDLTQGTIDVMTAALDVMKKVAMDKPCEGKADIFDGKRRYTIDFNHAQKTELKKTRYNVYSGEAIECVVEVKPVAGHWHEKPRGWLSIQEQGRNKGSLPTIWMAKISEDSPAVPVKLRLKTEYGTLFMHLREYNNGHTQIADKDD